MGSFEGQHQPYLPLLPLSFTRAASLIGILFAQGAIVSELKSQSGPGFVVEGCTDCSLRVSRVGRLSQPEPASEFVHHAMSIIQDSRGRIIAGPVGGFTSFAAYSSTGQLLRILGRPGSGPGEFRMIGAIAVTSHDSVLVVDPILHRLSIYSPSFEFVRSVRMAQVRRLVAVAGDKIVALADHRSGNAVGFALHEFDMRSGERLRSFGEDERLFGLAADARPRDEALASRFLATDASGSLLVSRDEPFRIEQYGRERSRVVANYQPSWLPFPTPRYRTRPGRAPTLETPRGEDELLEPRPRVAGLATLRDGTIVLAGMVPERDWRQHPNPHAATVGRAVDWSEKLTRADGWYATSVDYIDPSSGKLLGRTRLRSSAVRLLNNGMVAAVTVDNDGLLVVDVLQVHAPGGTRR